MPSCTRALSHVHPLTWIPSQRNTCPLSPQDPRLVVDKMEIRRNFVSRAEDNLDGFGDAQDEGPEAGAGQKGKAQ